MQRKVLFFDFDDTLFSHTRQSVPGSAKAALRRLQALGHRLVVATGRGPEAMGFIKRELGVPCDTLIVLNGQMIYHRGQLVYERFIELPSMDKIIRTAKEHGIPWGGYCREGIVADPMNERVKTVWRDFSCAPPRIAPDSVGSNRLYQGHLYITEEEHALFDGPIGEYITNRPHLLMINLIAKQAGKSQAIRHLLKEYGISPEDAYAFGDGFNDHDMLSAVGHGVAMGNAADTLKQAAEFVTGTADDDGIAYAIRHYFPL